ncbi:Na+/H+ antiporter subunit E, partial [Listeria monocytogenes]|nr:Na+/H+ antiporter subunit E [Listeria monocytogenes]
LSDDRKTLLVHGLDVPDKAALIAEIKQRYEAPLKEIFPCSLTGSRCAWRCSAWPCC